MTTGVKTNGEMPKLFSVSDLNVIHSMLRETDYSNENILTTSLDDTISEVDVQEDLYQSAVKKLYEISQPQYSFRTELDNLFSLEEFKAYQEPFDVGNYIRVGLEIHEELYDNNYIKLRLISMTYNPLETSESLSVEFSTMTKSLNGISDLAFLLDSNSSSGGSSSSGSSSGSSTYGNNDANVQISNNMLNALLKTEMFGTAVTDVILDSLEADKGKFKTLFSHSGVFDSLEAGLLKVSGDCMFGGIIQSLNYSAPNNTGSMINLTDGTFSFAGDNLIWNGNTLSVTGDIVANSITLQPNGTMTGVSSNNLSNGTDIILKDLGIGNRDAEKHNNNYIKVSRDGLLEADNAIIYGTIYANAGKFSGEISVDNKFVVDESGNVTANGTLTATNANIKGVINATNSIISESDFQGDVVSNKLTANLGNIGYFDFNNTSIFKNESDTENINSLYFGENGLFVKGLCSINDNNFYFKSEQDERCNLPYKYYCDVNIPQGDLLGITLIVKLQRNNTLCGLNNNECASGFSYYNNAPVKLKVCVNSVTFNDGTYYDKVYKIVPIYFPPQSDDFIEYKTDYYELGLRKTCIQTQYYPSIDETSVNIYDMVFSSNTDSFPYFDENGNRINKVLGAWSSNIENVSRGKFGFISEVCLDPDLYDVTMYDEVKIIRVDDFRGGQINNTFYSKNKKNFQLDCKKGILDLKKLHINQNGINLYDNYDIKILNLNDEMIFKLDINGLNLYHNNTEIFRLCSNGLYHNGLQTSSSGNNLIISDGNFYIKSSSSKRYKNSIQQLESSSLYDKLSPHNLYDIDIVSFKYNDDYLSPTDQRYQQEIPGFIAENVYEKYPIACNLDTNGNPEMWDINIMFPAALKLIQEQHKDIEELKDEIEKLKQK